MPSAKTRNQAKSGAVDRKKSTMVGAKRKSSSVVKTPSEPGSVRIRMYNVGFGDCFLITFLDKEQERRILIDCGSVSAGPRPMPKVVKSVISDCTGIDGAARIDVVIATHRHRDHVSGFADSAWRDVEVGEVWMPWTEHPTDPEARRIRETQSMLALLLTTRLAQFIANPGATAMDPARVKQLHELMTNALSNEAAMDMLHGGFSGPRRLRFLPEKDATSISFETDVLPGVAVYVLGPSRDPDVIRDMDPPSGKSYLRIADGLGLEGLPEPFRSTWHIPEDQWAIKLPHYLSPNLSAEHRAKLETLNSEMELSVATSLDKAVNGTSLMLVLKIGAKHLLFPGDSQWGTWQSVLKNPDTRALLRKAVFYKVGHHGSHNATPKEFVEEVMAVDMLSMCSTKPGTYNAVPREALLKALTDHHANVVRSDDMSVLPEQCVCDGDFHADLKIPLN
jgi:beta-lactamase superfamily II metal-dependent hydrolase